MILVDSSVWVDYFRGTPTPQSDRLDGLLGQEVVGIGDLILTEVLQGFTSEHAFEDARRKLDAIILIRIADGGVAVAAARNFRTLRALGVTPRKTIDTLIATRCLEDDLTLLHSDKDFDPFVVHLGMKSVFAPDAVA